MLKVSSINHYAPSFKANNNKSTGYFTKFGYIAPDSIECWENITKGYRVWEGDVDGKHIKMQMRRGPLYDEK